MRTLSLLALVLLLGSVSAQEKAKGKDGSRPVVLRLATLRVGQVGWLHELSSSQTRFVAGPTPLRFRVREIVGDEEMVVTHLDPRVPSYSLLVRGQRTAGLSVKDRVTLPGVWKVAAKERHRGMRVFVLELLEADKRKD